MELTPIQEFYKGRSVLITGATGFCGKALLEKLLRSCPDIGNIFLLMRPKRGQDVTVRLAKLFDDPVFDTVKSKLNMPLEHKVFPIFGDITQMGLGISAQNRDRLCREVSIVFHAAATIKFNENLKVALQTNALIYVSTAYSQCPIPEIEEKVYHPPHDPKRLSECVNWLSETDFQAIEPTILGKWPNTYSYSKALAEHIIHENRDILPVAIFRPSIVISTWKDPIPGWIDNMNGPTMGIMGCSMGMIRCGHVDKQKVSDMVPIPECTTSFPECSNPLSGVNISTHAENMPSETPLPVQSGTILWYFVKEDLRFCQRRFSWNSFLPAFRI
ncbi:hypothetical protein C0J52_19347 [Blattella germanica]|nr:hypothetical protein C0J52_19347 [Blattella germanica]